MTEFRQITKKQSYINKNILSKIFPIAPPKIIRNENFLKPFVLIDINAINIIIININAVKRLYKFLPKFKN